MVWCTWCVCLGMAGVRIYQNKGNTWKNKEHKLYCLLNALGVKLCTIIHKVILSYHFILLSMQVVITEVLMASVKYFSV